MDELELAKIIQETAKEYAEDMPEAKAFETVCAQFDISVARGRELVKLLDPQPTEAVS